MTERKLSDIAAEAVVFSLVADVAKTRKDEARAELASRMGAETLAVKAVANGNDIGRASWVEGKSKLAVTHPGMFTAFVAENYPDEMLTYVNPAFQTSLLSNAVVVDGTVVDAQGLPIPGVQVRQSDAYVSVRKSAEARATVEALLNSGSLRLDGIATPELIEGDS